MSGNTKLRLAAGVIVVAAGAAFGGWHYWNSPGAVAGRQLASATQAKAAGRTLQAAELFAAVAVSGTDASAAGVAGLQSLLVDQTLRALPAAQAAGVIAQASRARAAGRPPLPAQALAALGWSLVDAHAATDPAGAKAVLDAIAPLEADKDRIGAAAAPLLERIVAARPDDVAAAVELAVLLERRRDCGRCEALLLPHTARLARGEGARILGQIHAAKGRLDESYALLQPYTDDKLKTFVQREADYRKTVDELEKAAIASLRAGSAPRSFYDRYDAADEAGRRELVGSYINEQLSASEPLKRQMQSLRESAAIVPAALDLGMVTAQRAQKLQDPAAREAQLQAAEKVFLSIRGVAGDSDGYRLSLAQVYYWLGKQDEGRKLFDELLAAHGRAYPVLLDVAGLLRSVGAQNDARALIEEAYGKADNNDERWGAAHFRSVMFVDAEDELAWLEKADRSNARVRASIHSTRAQLAGRQGQRAAAKREFELAAGEYAKMPEDAATLNSSGLVHLALYALEGDPAQRDRGLARLDQALALAPADSILLMNNMAAVGSAAAAAIVADTIDLPLLRSPGDLGLLEFLHNDEASREQVYRRVRDNDAVKKALAYSEKAALLAPRNPQAYGFAAMVAGMLEDAAAMDALAARAQAAKLDLGDHETEQRKLSDGKDLKPRLEAMLAYSQQSAALLQQPALKRHPATWAVAASRWIEAQAMLARWGQPVDADAMVQVARQARSGHPSAATQWRLMQALETRAALRLAKADAAFAASMARQGRLVDVSSLLSTHLDEDPAFRRLALADADIVEVMALVRDRATRYPSKASVWSWLLFRHADPKQADALAARLRSDPQHAAQTALERVFEPRSGETVIRRYHLALLAGDRAQAQRVLDEARRDGLVLPEVLGRQIRGA